MAQGVWESVHYSHEETIPRLGNAHLESSMRILSKKCPFFETGFPF
jgi:hypothetical protein